MFFPYPRCRAFSALAFSKTRKWISRSQFFLTAELTCLNSFLKNDLDQREESLRPCRNVTLRYGGTLKETWKRGSVEPVGRTLFALDGEARRAYPIVEVEEVEGQTRVFTQRDHQGFEARPAEWWEVPMTVGWEGID